MKAVFDWEYDDIKFWHDDVKTFVRVLYTPNAKRPVRAATIYKNDGKHPYLQSNYGHINDGRYSAVIHTSITLPQPRYKIFDTVEEAKSYADDYINKLGYKTFPLHMKMLI